MPPSFEGGAQPEREDLVRQPERDDTPAHGEHIGVVVFARQPRGIEIVAQRRPNAGHFVGRDLLALSAAAEHDAAIGPPLGNRAADGDADRRVIHRRLARRAMVIDRVAEAR